MCEDRYGQLFEKSFFALQAKFGRCRHESLFTNVSKEINPMLLHCVLFYRFLGAPGSKCVSNTRPSAYWGEIVHKITGRHLISLLTLKKGSSCYILWPTWKANFRVSATFLFFTMTLNRNCMNLKIVHFRMISGETSFELYDIFCCVLIRLRSLDFYSFPSRIISTGWICFSYFKDWDHVDFTVSKQNGYLLVAERKEYFL